MTRLLTGLACIGLTASGIAEPAFALSCDFRDHVERTFAIHHERSEHYVVGYGILVPNESVPIFNQETQRLEPNQIDARFEGRLAGPDGFDTRASFEITVSIDCMVDACGYVPEERPALMFIETEGGRYSVTTDYCDGSILYNPTQGEMLRLLECLNGSVCDAR